MTVRDGAGPVQRLASTPRAVPGRLAPALAGTGVIVLALPVFVVVGWSLQGWALAATLWACLQGFGLLLERLPLEEGRVAAAGMRGIGMTLRAAIAGIVLVVATVTNESVGGAAALVYVLAYTTELAVSLVAYFGQEKPA